MIFRSHFWLKLLKVVAQLKQDNCALLLSDFAIKASIFDDERETNERKRTMSLLADAIFTWDPGPPKILTGKMISLDVEDSDIFDDVKVNLRCHASDPSITQIVRDYSTDDSKWENLPIGALHMNSRSKS